MSDHHTRPAPPPLPPDMGGNPDALKACRGCGNPIHSSARSCPKCGAVQAGRIGRKSRVVAALLAFFLGGFGIHKFYLGQIGWGILYLLFCWTFIPALVAFIEFIIYLATSDEAFAEKYG